MNNKIRLTLLALTATILLILVVSLPLPDQGLSLFSQIEFSAPARALQSEPSTPEPVVLTDQQQEYPLGLYLEVLEDPGGKLTIEDVSSPEYDSQFIPSQEENPVYGFTESAYWVRVLLDNQTSQTGEWLLEVGFPNVHYVDLYSSLPGGGGFDVKQSGILRPVTSRDIPFPLIIFKLDIPNRSQAVYYLRFQSGASMSLDLNLWTSDAFLVHAQREQMLHWLFFGSMIAMLVYHLFLLFSLRETLYLYFVILLASLLITVFTYDGHMAVLLPNLFALHPNLFAIFYGSLILTIILFSDAFLELKARQPGLHRVNTLLMASWAGLIPLTLFVSYLSITKITVPWSIVSLVWVVIAGIIAWRRSVNPIFFFLFAWLGMTASILLVLLVRLAIVPSTYFSENVFHLGLLLMAVSWSIALTERINLLKANTEQANRALLNSEHKLSQILEGLPIGVVVYGKDRKPNYGNRRIYEILSNPSRGMRPDVSAGRTLEKAIDYYSLKKQNTDDAYPLEKFPVQSALQGQAAYADDIEADLGDRRIPLEIWASPVRDDAGNVESAIVALQDITRRKQAEAELIGYRDHLEALVEERTTSLNEANEKLQLRLNWLSAVNRVHQEIAGIESLADGYTELSGEILRIFHARLVFILHWNDRDRLSVSFRCSDADGGDHDINPLMALFKEGAPLRQEVERGELIAYSPDQTEPFSALFPECFPDQDIPSLILAPVTIAQSVIGVLGVAVTEPSQGILLEQSALVERMALDLASLTQGALLHNQALVLATVEERNRLAGELHDSVTQTLFTASVLAEATPHIWEKDQGIARQNMGKLSRLIRGALAEMRSMLIELRLGDLRNQALDQLLSTLVDGARARSQSVINLSFMGDLPELPEKVTLAFYRIAREALNNAAVHSGASEVQVSLSGEQERLVLRVEDDGCGFDPQHVPAGHLGIRIMSERAQEIGARLHIHTVPSQGTMIRVAWPDPVGDDQT